MQTQSVRASVALGGNMSSGMGEQKFDPPSEAVDGTEERLKRLEASLRERERQLEETQRAVAVGLWNWDVASDTVTWSDELYRIHGRPKTFRPKNIAELRAGRAEGPPSWGILLDAMDRTLATGEPYELDIEIVRPTGERRWIIARGQRDFDEHGAVKGIRGTVQDITDRKLAELELREAQRAARLGTWRWVASSDTTTWSEEVYRVFGLKPGSRVPGFQEMSLLHAPESRRRLAQAVERALRSGTAYEQDMELLLPDGTRRWIIASGGVETYVDGKPAVLRGTVQDITERKLTEQRFQRMYDSDLMGIGFPDATGVIHECNDALLRIIGYTREDLEAGPLRWDMMTPPEYRTVDLEHIREAAERGSCTPYRKEYIRKDGSRVPILCGFARLSGGENRSIGFILDLGPQERAETALRHALSRFDKLYRAGLVGICSPDRFGAFSDGNAEFLRIVGYSEEDLRAGLVRWDVMTPPEYAALDAEHIAEAAERGSCTPYEKEYIRKDGKRVPILCGYALQDGSTDEYIAFVMDLSPVKLAEAATREREQRFSALAESLPELVWMSNPNGERVYTSKRYQEYTGMKSEELMGSRWRQLLHPDDLAHTDTLWQRCMESGELYQNEYRIRRHDGLYRSFLVRGVAVRNEAGEIEQWVGSATDIHDRKLAEEAVRRTEKLAAAGRLAASIAHEINNPLAAVMNSLYLALMDEDLGAATRQYLKTAEQELARAAHVTTQTLQFHRQTSTPRPADLAAVMESAFELFATRFRTSDVLVEREYEARTLLYCCADELRQVFANLLSNSLDAMRQGGRLRIRIREAHSWPATPEAEPRPGLRVSLADTGQGIPAEVMARLFEPFLSTKEATGTGLGLWVSEGIVKKHHGVVRVHSRIAEPARGTVFSLFFPLDGLRR
jgi:PAS domain S-box-containing protein